GADRDQVAALFADADDAARVGGSGDTPLDERDIVRTGQGPAARLGEVGKVDLSGEAQQLVLGVQELQLAAVAGRKLEYGDARLHIPVVRNSSFTARYENTGPSLQAKYSRYWQ